MGYFSILTFIYMGRVGFGLGSGRFFEKTRTRLRPTLGFFFYFFLIHTQPYNLLGQVKSDPLGSGRVGYPWIGSKLPSLNPT